MATPRSRASRACTSLRSSRSAWLLISSATPWRPRRPRSRRCRPDTPALQKQAAGRVADDVDVRVLDRAQEAVGHLLAVLVERRVDRGDDDVERGEAVVGEIQRAVRPDVALDAGEQPDAVLAVERADPRGVRERARFVEAVGHRERLAVVGDRDVLEPGGACAGLAMSATLSRPSVSVVCMCRSPRRSPPLDQAGQRRAVRRPRSRRGPRAVPAGSRPGRAPRRSPPPSRRRRARRRRCGRGRTRSA